MIKILQFPGGGNAPTPLEKSANDDSAAALQQRKHAKAASFAKGMIKGLWVLAVLTWPRNVSIDLKHQTKNEESLNLSIKHGFSPFGVG